MSMKYIQNKTIIQSAIGDEVVMMDIDSGFYFGLNTVASVIWSKLETAIGFDELIDQLLGIYIIDRQTCEVDTKELLDQFLEKNIIKLVE